MKASFIRLVIDEFRGALERMSGVVNRRRARFGGLLGVIVAVGSTNRVRSVDFGLQILIDVLGEVVGYFNILCAMEDFPRNSSDGTSAELVLGLSSGKNHAGKYLK